MRLIEAVFVVLRDQAEGDFDPEQDSIQDEIMGVRNVLRLPEEPPVPGAYPIDEDDSDSGRAYRVVLSAGVESHPAEDHIILFNDSERLMIRNHIIDVLDDDGDIIETFAGLR